VILLALGLLGIGTADLVRRSPERVDLHQAVGAVVAGAAATAGLAALAGARFAQVLLVAAVATLVAGVWVSFDYPTLRKGSVAPLGCLGVVMAALFAASGSVGSISGPLEDWYAGLGFDFIDSLSVDQFVLGLSAAIFMTASGNRIVRLVLDAAGVSRRTSENALKGVACWGR
jgi:hypothetical protein